MTSPRRNLEVRVAVGLSHAELTRDEYRAEPPELQLQLVGPDGLVARIRVGKGVEGEGVRRTPEQCLHPIDRALVDVVPTVEKLLVAEVDPECEAQRVEVVRGVELSSFVPGVRIVL